MTSTKKSQPWGTLGTGDRAVKFYLLTSPQSYSTSYDYNFVEQARIQGKPTLQAVGGTLRKIDLAFRFHHMFCNPQTELNKLLKLAERKEALPFTLGELYQGDWVITSVPLTLKKTDAGGLLLYIEVQLKLLEWAGEKKKQRGGGQAAIASSGVGLGAAFARRARG